MLFSSETTLKNLPILAVLAEGFLQKKFYNINYFWSLQKRGKEKSFYYFLESCERGNFLTKRLLKTERRNQQKKRFFKD